MKSTRILAVVVLAVIICLARVSKAEPMGTAWTYQGRLMDANLPADGLYDFEFSLYDSNDPCTGNQRGSAIHVNDIDVLDGYFTAKLDFDANAFRGDDIWLQVGLRPDGSTEPFNLLSPRQQVTPTPYAIYAASVPVPLEIKGSGLTPGPLIDAWQPVTHCSLASDIAVYGEHFTSSTYGYLAAGNVGAFGRSSAGFGLQAVTDTGYAVYATAWESSGYAGHFEGKTKVIGNLLVDGNVGVGTTDPQQNLSVWGGMNIDQESVNDGNLSPGLHFGHGWSGEGIASKRTSGGNRYGLDFYTGSINRMAITRQGNVGIGTTDVKGHKLYVNGSIGHQAETRYYTIPGVAFTGRYDSSPYDKYDSIFRNNHTTVGHQYYAPVNLPHGAHITDITVGYRSLDSSGELVVHLYGRGLLGDGIWLAGIEPLLGGGSWTTASSSVDATVDNANYGYYMFLYLQNNGATNHQLVSNVRLTYTVERPLP